MMKCIHPPEYIKPTGEFAWRHCDKTPGGYIRWEVFICSLCGAKFTAPEVSAKAVAIPTA
jgi:hypothetical protein